MATVVRDPRWPVVYGGMIGRVLAILVLVAVLVLVLTGEVDTNRLLALIAADSAAILLL